MSSEGQRDDSDFGDAGAEGESFDLAAASLRADGAELSIAIEVLASKLEDALGEAVSVERRKVGGFRSRRREVQRIALTLGDEQFELRRASGALQCTRHKVVRGITLSHQEIPVSDWAKEVTEGVARTATLSEQTRLALEGLLR